MRKRVTIAAVLVVFLAAVVWWALPSQETVGEGPEHASDRVRKVFEGPSPETNTPPSRIPEALVKALSICAECASGVRQDDLCTACVGDSSEPVPPDDAPPPTVELFVDVVNEDGRPEDRARLNVGGCPVVARQGNVFHVGPGLECTVQAFRKEGALWISSEVVHVDVGPEGAYAQVEMPRAKVGGLGISFGKHPEGVVVVRVMPGTPAAEMGLEHGDVITEVDGKPTRDLSQQDFVRTMTGPVGSEVEFTLQYRDESGTRLESKQLRRAYLEG